jgi:4'-phosphopantetheinyl transferase
MEVRWLEQSETDVPALDDWLSAAEIARLRGMRFEKRRADWRLGRWTVKVAACLHLGIPRGRDGLRGIEVRPEPLGAPVVWIADRPAPFTISLSHRAGIAVCAIAAAGVELGCDLEVVEARSAAFLADYFSPLERAFVEQAPTLERPQKMALLWSAKESLLKALRVGLRIDTREVAVSVDGAPSAAGGVADWRPLRISCQRRFFDGWWRSAGQVVHTVVAAPRARVPSHLTFNQEVCP